MLLFLFSIYMLMYQYLFKTLINLIIIKEIIGEYYGKSKVNY
ncbi:hypothetical protein Xish_02997 [Xenorhabdus ishibashii]|uniref:Uncharacterized protein n=1 Tax=Xenorhabdus ishibashii TaxID=1034471 RepID=A0A2D0KKI2_9GAMM|nr:hypothetical protein Xish_02997 [Xenorhabdus ishibashii]